MATLPNFVQSRFNGDLGLQLFCLGPMQLRSKIAFASFKFVMNQLILTN